MPLGVSYMGTKRALASKVSDQVAGSKDGPLLDLFAGMCSVGTAVGTARPVWNNDLQHFASSVAHSFFCSTSCPPAHLDVRDFVRVHYLENYDTLQSRYRELLQRESEALNSRSVHGLLDLSNDRLAFASSDDASDQRIASKTDTHSPYCLFVLNFSASYLGVKQCIEVDSIRYALDRQVACGALTSEVHEWLCLGLGKAISRCASSTGHFAQPLSPKDANVGRYVRQRRRSIWDEWLGSIDDLAPLGNSGWRKKNRTFRGDAIELIEEWDGPSPAVIYADPPYTNDQYSRYYHLYDTLLLYDYPASAGVGRYREDRGVSTFSLKAGVMSAMERLISGVAKMGSDLIISYPVNGLMANSLELIPKMLNKEFKTVCDPITFSHSHSTMGGSKGAASNVVTEVLYRAIA